MLVDLSWADSIRLALILGSITRFLKTNPNPFAWQRWTTPTGVQYPLREGWDTVATLRLDSACNSRMGHLLMRYGTLRGTVFQITDPVSNRPVTMRFHHTGKGRHRRFFVSPTERKTHI